MAKRILIADDSLTIQKAFAMTFAGEGVTLLAARSADEGLTITRQARPELVIADGLMPGRSGYDLCAAIKADPALRGVPVYILVSSQNPYDEDRGRESGADGQLTKPFDSTALVERVNEVLAKGPSSLALATPAADDDYGEITVEASGPTEAPQPIAVVRPAMPPVISPWSSASDITPPPRVPLSAPVPQRPPAPAAAAVPPGVLRPSLIPGLRPGAVPAARPGTIPARPVAMPGSTVHMASAGPGMSPPPAAGYSGPPGPAPAARGPVPSASPISPGPHRTLMGLPASAVQPPARIVAPVPPARPVTQPVQTLDARTPSPSAVNPFTPAVLSKVDQKVAAIAARGPEYEVLAKLSREIIEKIVWEIVPELAEVIVREELQKRGRI